MIKTFRSKMSSKPSDVPSGRYFIRMLQASSTVESLVMFAMFSDL